MTAIVFDTTCVSHFARAGCLTVLEAVTAQFERIIPNEVASEIQRGTDSYPALSSVFDLPWLTIVELDFPEVVYAATFKAELGGSPYQHLGECAVLAWVKQRGGLAIIDDAAATAMAGRHDISVRGTLSLIALAYTARTLDRNAAVALVDDLASTDMRLPVDGAGFFAWAYGEGLISPESAR